MERAEKRNAIDRAMADALDDALNELDDDQDLWAGVLTGSTDVFSAGSDLTAGGDYARARGGEYGIIRRRRRKPLDRRGRGSRPRRRAGDRPRLRSRGGGQHGPLRPAGGRHRRRADLRRPLPGTAGPAPQRRQAAHPHGPADRGRARLRGRLRQRPHRAGRGRWPKPCHWPTSSAPTPRSRCRRAWPPSTTSSPPTTSWAGRRPIGRCAPRSVQPTPARACAAFLEKRPPVWTGR